MKLLSFLFPAPIAGLFMAGCQTSGGSGAASAIIFAREESGGRAYYIQDAGGSGAPAALPVPASAGNLRTAPRAGIAAATIGASGAGEAELRLIALGAAGGSERSLAREWAWDYSLGAEGEAIAWIAGRDRRELFVARAPEWKPAALALPVEAEPGQPRWLARDRLLVVLRWKAGGEALALAGGAGGAEVIYRAVGRAVLSEACGIPGSADVLVIESPEGDSPGRLLRIAIEGGQPEVLAHGFFLPGTLAVSPDGRFVGAVWSEAAAAVRRGEAAWRWIGAAWPGAPESVPGVVSAVWSPDGSRLAFARRGEGRRWIEVHGSEPGRPRRVGFEEAECFAPQWWRIAR
ncbi:MAG: PD40 domain-containing protein [Opitutaceae bacterium]|nr:PD40 domain-containing protein [Opitutaceae bacterium]